MASQTNKALFLQSKFGKFEVGEASITHPGPGEVLIKVKATALNPVDWKIQKYGIFVEHFPSIQGSELAGDVEEVGEGVVSLEKGDKVFTQASRAQHKAAHQQYVIASAVTTAKIPDGFSYDDLAAIPVGLSTAYSGLYSQSPHGFGLVPPTSPEARIKHTGQPILIMGGASVVGQSVIQLAKLSNFSPIITTASLHNAEALKALGASHVLDRGLTLPSFASKVNEILGSKTLTVIYDAISTPDTQNAALNVLAPGGTLGVVLPPVESIPEGKIVQHIIGSIELPNNIPLLTALYRDHISNWIAEGIIKPPRVEILPGGLAGIPEGLKRLESDSVSRTKLIARPHETI